MTEVEDANRKGLILGFYEGEKDGEVSLTRAAQKFQNEKNKDLVQLINISGMAQKKSKTRLFCNIDTEFQEVALTNLGKKGVGVNELEEIDEGRENIRTGVAAAVRQLNEVGVRNIQVDTCSDAEAAAEGSHLCLFQYDELKSADKRKALPNIQTYGESTDEKSAWDKGVVMAEAQNFAKYLMDAPANEMTPTIFARKAAEKLGVLDNVTVTPRDKAWATEKKMGGFLSVTQGSDEPAVFLEVEYKGNADPPVAFVGKGVTFDSGGISIKPSANMEDMRADMGGAACVLSSIFAAAKLKLPLHIVGFMPLTENMPGGSATKPGDVHKAMNGKSIQIDNTDAEGRLILSDALCYAATFNPTAIIDLATLTGAMMISLGASATGVFTNSKTLWQQMHEAGIKSGDRVWRMPLLKYFSKQVTESHLADVNNIGTAGRIGGSCTAAAFLREFVTHDHWMHMDIAGVMSNTNQVPYLPKGMSGRPTRTLVEFMTKYQKP